MTQVLVVGSGVSGLSVGVRLLEEGHDVRIWSDAPPERTTSAVAAAIWYPYRAYPEDRVLAWGRRSFEVFVELADEPGTGVALRAGTELARHELPDPWWSAAVLGLRHVEADGLPDGYTDGLTYTVPVVEMPLYLRWLRDRFADLGGRIEDRHLEDLGPALEAAPVVANCAGIGARDLVDDPTLEPIRGQVVVVENPGIERFWLDEEHPEGIVYIIPRSRDVVCGGTAEEGEWDLDPDPATADAILARCARLEPGLADARVLEHKVGLRPGRPTVRLEAERRDDGLVIHDYGHGGAGVTLSWGCAEAAAELVRSG